MDERLVADNSLTVVMEADLATGTMRPEVQFNQFLTDKLRAWKHVQADHVACEREELEDMRVANSVAYARDLKELHLARLEVAEELRLHQLFMVQQHTAIQEEQEHLTQQLAKSAQLEVELAKHDTRLTAQERHLEEALEAFQAEKRAFQAEREAIEMQLKLGKLTCYVLTDSNNSPFQHLPH